MNSNTGRGGSATAGFPIRISPDFRLYTATRGFSQCPTSFFGIWRLGILRKLLVASLRDAESSKLFASFLRSRLLLSYPIRLVRCSGLPPSSPPVDRPALPPLPQTQLDSQPGFFDEQTRLFRPGLYASAQNCLMSSSGISQMS
jgi:hypothetical protein